MDQTKPSWIDGRLRFNKLEDEIAYFQYGAAEEQDFFSYSMSETHPSSWINWPTAEKPLNKYKYAGIEFNMSLD